MNTYARTQNGIVAEIITTAVNPSSLFNPELQWFQVTTVGVTTGWTATTNTTTGAMNFAAPPQPSPGVPVTPSLAQLQAELAALTSRIAMLTAVTKTGG